MIRETSLDAYHSLEDRGLLQPMERRVMLVFHSTRGQHTRKELSALCHMPINAVCGRVNSLVKKGFLEELPERRDGGYLLRIKQAQQELALA
jgi:DNA-binding MarR family transcriptional regulator